MFDGQLKFPCLKKDEKISAQKSAIKEALKKLSKNITNEDVANLLTQIGLLADHMVAQAKDTVAGMEPYSFKVQLGNGPQTVAYYELMFDAELEKRANPDLFKRIYKQFLSIATFTFLINELKLNKEEFFQRYSSTDGGQTYELKKSAPIFGIAAVVGSCVGCCQSSKLKKKQHKLNRLSEAQDELISKKAGKSHLN
uniref:Lipoprotein n=1 Tax=Globodera pallida TaxID=36090 RepID=A0A183C3U9_GLOPA